MKPTTSTISNPINDSLLRRALMFIPFVLMCVATLPGAQAVSPAGHGSLEHNTTGNENTAMGMVALGNNTTGSRNIALGDSAGDLVVDANDVICIGTRGENVSNSCYIAQINGATIANGTPVFVNGFNKLGTMTSSRQFKKDINTMEKGSEAILALRPVTFHYKSDANRTPQFGLIAEEVAKVNPALVLPDKEGKPYTVRYEAVNAMLLNEFLKEHCTVQELKSTVAKQEAAILQQKKDFQAIASQQQKQIEALYAGLQKVSAQLAAASPSGGGLEASKFATGRIRRGGPAPQVVNNP